MLKVVVFCVGLVCGIMIGAGIVGLCERMEEYR